MDDLTTLFHDAVDDIEPADRLGEIRRRTQTRPRHRSWYAVGGAVLATAAVVTGIAIAVQPSSDPGPGPSKDPTATESATESATPGLSSTPVYYLGETPQGTRLYREFQQTTPLGADLLRLVESAPEDPDYTTPWPAGSFGDVVVRSDLGQIDVTLADSSLHDRPAGMSDETAELAIQQVIYSVQAVVQNRLPVQFRLNGNPVDQVLGVPTSEPLANAPQFDVLALVSISNPAEGRIVEGSFTADGVAASFEGSVPWQLKNAGGEVVRSGTGQGSMEDHLTPWETGPIDVSGLPPGQYTFVAMTDDASGGEGGGPTVDTRTITIR
jgi:hypothetical protein